MSVADDESEGGPVTVRVGLTGGIGAGKSTVSAMLAEKGAVVIDSDVLAREVVAPGSPGLAAVVDAFGTDVLTPDGELDRLALGRVVFADPDARRRLEAITHPLVRARARDIEAGTCAGTVVVHDIPLLVETGQQDKFDAVVVVEAAVEAQLQRLRQTRGMAAEDARARIAAQATSEQRRAAADYVIVNDGSLDDLRRRVDEVWSALTAAASAR
ncbi:MAG TPA: dephospho-CoA kinase [Nocardioidaceae bacterium]|nr:dephospho-CoA kinase [Nocardioidaceae bacterium]